MRSRRPALAAALSLAVAGLAGCGSGEEDPETKAAAAWLKQYKAEHRAEAEQFAQECVEDGGFPITRDGMLELVDCMKARAAEADSAR